MEYQIVLQDIQKLTLKCERSDTVQSKVEDIQLRQVDTSQFDNFAKLLAKKMWCLLSWHLKHFIWT